jgi:hypothetical protein
MVSGESWIPRHGTKERDAFMEKMMARYPVEFEGATFGGVKVWAVTPKRPASNKGDYLLPIVDNGWSPYDTVDGQRFLVRAVPQQASPPLTLIVNWPALLKKGSAAQ